MTQLQQLISTLCDADHATTTNNWQREISNIICTCNELTLAAQEEYLDRWADGVFRLFDPYDYQLYRVYVETTDPLLTLTPEYKESFCCSHCGLDCRLFGMFPTAQGELCRECLEEIAFTTSPGEQA